MVNVCPGNTYFSQHVGWRQRLCCHISGKKHARQRACQHVRSHLEQTLVCEVSSDGLAGDLLAVG